MSIPYHHPELSEEQRMIVDAVAEFAREQLAPVATELDEAAVLPDETRSQLAELGMLAIPIPEERGGSGFDFTSYAFALVELAAASGGIGLHVLVQTSGFLEPVARFGGPAEIIAGVAGGETRGCLAVLEESGDFGTGHLETEVTGAGGELRLSGKKMFVLDGSLAAHALVFAKEGDSTSAFLVDLTLDGVGRSVPRRRLGLRVVPSCDITFDGVALADGARLGAAGEGDAILAFVRNRMMAATTALGCGLIRASRDCAAQYATERRQFERPISDFDAIRERLARVETGYVASINLLASAAALIDADRDATHVAEAAKIISSDAAMSAADDALQIYGGYGYSREYPVERLYRDARYVALSLGGNDAGRLRLAERILPTD